MKTNAAFIVRYRKEGEMFDTVKVITEGVLAKDIKAQFKETFPEVNIKSKLFDQMASEAIHKLNGSATDEEGYKENLRECTAILYHYTQSTLLEFGNLVSKAQAYDRSVAGQDEPVTKQHQEKEPSK